MSIKKKKITCFDVVNHILLILMMMAFIWPLLITLSTALSDNLKLAAQPVYLLPYGFSFDAIKYILSNQIIWKYYGNTVKYAAVGCAIMLTVTSLSAYPLSIQGFRGKKLITVLYTITMFFGGGLIPSYLNIRNLGMMDTIWAMVIPGAVGAYNVMVFKTFFMGIPSSLSESAFLDGADHAQVLVHIVLPLSKALMATFALFHVVGVWNNYLTSTIYMSGENQSIQAFLRTILIEVDTRMLDDPAKMAEAVQNVSSRTIRAAVVVVTVTPILCVYPFVQKYFAQGVLVGSIKA